MHTLVQMSVIVSALAAGLGFVEVTRRHRACLRFERELRMIPVAHRKR